MPQVPPLALPDEYLRHTFAAGELDDCVDGVLAIQNFYPGAGLPGDPQISFKRGFVFLRKLRLLHVRDVQFAMESFGVAPSALDDLGGVRLRSDAYHDALLRAPLEGNAIVFQILLELMLNHFRGENQS